MILILQYGYNHIPNLELDSPRTKENFFEGSDPPLLSAILEIDGKMATILKKIIS